MSTAATADSDILTLPNAEVVFGVGGDLRHAVTREMALRAVDDGPIRSAITAAVCGQLVALAPRWGAYQRDSQYLQRGDACPACAWIIAGARDELDAQIAAAMPAEKNRSVIASALRDPLAGVRLLEAIAADDDLALIHRSTGWLSGCRNEESAL